MQASGEKSTTAQCERWQRQQHSHSPWLGSCRAAQSDRQCLGDRAEGVECTGLNAAVQGPHMYTAAVALPHGRYASPFSCITAAGCSAAPRTRGFTAALSCYYCHSGCMAMNPQETSRTCHQKEGVGDAAQLVNHSVARLQLRQWEGAAVGGQRCACHGQPALHMPLPCHAVPAAGAMASWPINGASLPSRHAHPPGIFPTKSEAHPRQPGIQLAPHIGARLLRNCRPRLRKPAGQLNSCSCKGQGGQSQMRSSSRDNAAPQHIRECRY